MKLLVSVLPVFLCVYMAIKAEIDTYLIALLLTIYTILFFLFSFQENHLIKRQLFKIANLFEALNNGDYQVRSTTDGTEQDKYISEQINGLINKLAHQTGALEEQRVLLRQIIENMNTLIIALNESGEIIFSNYKAKQLLELSKDKESLANLLGILFNADSEDIIRIPDDEVDIEFFLKREQFFRHGKKHHLIILSEVGQLLNDRENSSWKRLIRVIGHEINNSIMPIKNISQTLSHLIKDSEENNKISQGIRIIQERSDYLSRFIGNYCRLAQLPDPCRTPVALSQLLSNVVSLFPECHFKIEVDEDVVVIVDPIQMQQALINIVKNSSEAMKSGRGNIVITCVAKLRHYVIDIIDDGVGVSNPENLFIPFYSTKPGGSGIGLMLSRQIIFNHEGYLTILNRTDQHGAIARILLKK